MDLISAVDVETALMMINSYTAYTFSNVEYTRSNDGIKTKTKASVGYRKSANGRKQDHVKQRKKKKSEKIYIYTSLDNIIFFNDSSYPFNNKDKR